MMFLKASNRIELGWFHLVIMSPALIFLDLITADIFALFQSIIFIYKLAPAMSVSQDDCALFGRVRHAGRTLDAHSFARTL